MTMTRLGFDIPSDRPLRVLLLGAHSDDIEIGCGGTVLRLIDEHPSCQLDWVVLSGIGIRRCEAERGAQLFAGKANLANLIIRDFRDGFFPYNGVQVKSLFEELKGLPSPDVIFTHSRKDAHQDHRLLCELTWNTFRNHFILEYEIPKYDGDLGQPSLYVPLDSEHCDRKIRILMDVFKSQQSKAWFEDSIFRSLLRLRGMECNSVAGYAEAFYCRKIVI